VCVSVVVRVVSVMMMSSGSWVSRFSVVVLMLMSCVLNCGLCLLVLSVL